MNPERDDVEKQVKALMGRVLELENKLGAHIPDASAAGFNYPHPHLKVSSLTAGDEDILISDEGIQIVSVENAFGGDERTRTIQWVTEMGPDGDVVAEIGGTFVDSGGDTTKSLSNGIYLDGVDQGLWRVFIKDNIDSVPTLATITFTYDAPALDRSRFYIRNGAAEFLYAHGPVEEGDTAHLSIGPTNSGVPADEVTVVLCPVAMEDFPTTDPSFPGMIAIGPDYVTGDLWWWDGLAWSQVTNVGGSSVIAPDFWGSVAGQHYWWGLTLTTAPSGWTYTGIVASGTPAGDFNSSADHTPRHARMADASDAIASPAVFGSYAHMQAVEDAIGSAVTTLCLEVYGRFATASNNENSTGFGFAIGTADTDHAAFIASDGTNFIFRSAGASDTGAVVDTSFHLWKITVNSTTSEWFIDGVSQGTIATVGDLWPCSFRAFITTNNDLEIAWAHVWYE